MTDQMMPGENESARYVTAYFEEMVDACKRALLTHGRTVERILAGHTLRYRIAGEALARILQQAVEHLPLGEGDESSFTIFAWDEYESEVAQPQAPWRWPAEGQAVELTLPQGAEDFSPLYDAARGVFGLYQHSMRTAVVCFKQASLLPTPWYGAPLFRMFHWWSQSVGLVLLHAGCVGNDRGAVLIAGKGGSGKSTTSLLSLQAGLRYVSDDYCLLDNNAEVPRVHCLYNTGKLHRDHITRFPALAEKAVEAVMDDYEKKLIFVHRHFPQQLALSMPLRAIFLPSIVGGKGHRLVPVSPGVALRGLAPSTLFQLSGHGRHHLQVMADLMRKLPAYRLELGTDFASIPATIESYLNQS